MKIVVRFAALAICLFFACAGGIDAQPGDVEAIRALQDEQAAAWNRHDARAYARLFTEDGEVVNVQGWWWKGRDEVERKLSQAFAFVFAESRLRIGEVHVKLLEPNYALAHVIWQMDGARAPPGAPSPPREGIQLQVLRRGSDGWRIVSFQNTNRIPEVPFPTAPPVRAFSVDVPHGGCRLTVQNDGNASIVYGAMPRWVHVTQGTFDFDEVVAQLRTRSLPEGNHSLLNESVGTLSLPNSDTVLLINDVAFVRSLLERAWHARVMPRGPSETEDYRWVARACSFS